MQNPPKVADGTAPVAQAFLPVFRVRVQHRVRLRGEILSQPQALEGVKKWIHWKNSRSKSNPDLRKFVAGKIG